MLSQRKAMRFRVSRKFARVPGQHGDFNPPMYYPMPINPGQWGQPWSKVKAPSQLTACCIAIPCAVYFVYKGWWQHRMRLMQVGRAPSRWQFYFAFTDLDDPDFLIKWKELQREKQEGILWGGYGGTNFIASYLWEPGDPEPDIRRREPPAAHGHH